MTTLSLNAASPISVDPNNRASSSSLQGVSSGTRRYDSQRKVLEAEHALRIVIRHENAVHIADASLQTAELVIIFRRNHLYLSIPDLMRS
jgi:hypothetical protein